MNAVELLELGQIAIRPNLSGVSIASVDDLLDLRTAKKAFGRLTHRDCGGQVVWSSLTDRARCMWCKFAISRPDLQAIAHGRYKNQDLGVDIVK